MEGRSDVALAVTVLAAIAFVLLAPILGRAGLPRVADVMMGLAAACGVGSFALAAAHTWRAARRSRQRRERVREPAQGPGRER